MKPITVIRERLIAMGGQAGLCQPRPRGSLRMFRQGGRGVSRVPRAAEPPRRRDPWSSPPGRRGPPRLPRGKCNDPRPPLAAARGETAHARALRTRLCENAAQCTSPEHPAGGAARSKHAYGGGEAAGRGPRAGRAYALIRQAVEQLGQLARKRRVRVRRAIVRRAACAAQRRTGGGARARTQPRSATGAQLRKGSACSCRAMEPTSVICCGTRFGARRAAAHQVEAQHAAIVRPDQLARQEAQVGGRAQESMHQHYQRPCRRRTPRARHSGTHNPRPRLHGCGYHSHAAPRRAPHTHAA